MSRVLFMMNIKHWTLTILIAAGCFSLGYLTRGQSSQKSQNNNEAETQIRKNHRSTQKLPTVAHRISERSGKVSDRLLSLDPNLEKKSWEALDSMIFEEMFFSLARQDAEAAAKFLEENQNMNDWSSIASELVLEWVITNPAKAYEWVEANRASFSPDEFNETAGHALNRYAKKDPIAVSQIFNSIESPLLQQDVALSVAQSWGAVDHDAALAWLGGAAGEALPPNILIEAYQEILTGFISKDPIRATETITQINSPILRNELLQDAGQAVGLQGSDQAKSWLAGLDSSQEKLAGLEGISRALQEHQPDAVFTLIVDNAEAFSGNDELSASVFSNLARNNPGIVRERFSEIPEESKSAVAADLVSNWNQSGSDRESLGNWVSDLPEGPIFDRGAEAFALSMAHQNIEGSIRLAGRLSDPVIRDRLLRGLISKADADRLSRIQNVIGTVGMSAQEQSQFSELIDKRALDAAPNLPLPY